MAGLPYHHDCSLTDLSETLKNLTIDGKPSYFPFVRRKITYPCGCMQRDDDVPSLHDEANIPATSVFSDRTWLSARNPTKGLHIDAEFIYEDSQATRQWRQGDEQYAACFGPADHAPTCDLHQKYQPFRGHGVYGPLYRALPTRTLTIFRCACQVSSSLVLPNLDISASTPIARLRRWDTEQARRWLFLLRDFRPLNLLSGIHMDAEFCWGLVEYERQWCEACVGVVGELVKAAEEMCLDWYPTQKWIGQTKSSSKSSSGTDSGSTKDSWTTCITLLGGTECSDEEWWEDGEGCWHRLGENGVKMRGGAGEEEDLEITALLEPDSSSDSPIPDRNEDKTDQYEASECMICFEPCLPTKRRHTLRSKSLLCPAHDPHTLYALPCGHVFGRPCLSGWVRAGQELHKCCPKCRQRFWTRRIALAHALMGWMRL